MIFARLHRTAPGTGQPMTNFLDTRRSALARSLSQCALVEAIRAQGGCIRQQASRWARPEEGSRNIATAPKSNSTVMAIGAAMKDVESGRTLAVPEHLRDSHYAGAKRLSVPDWTDGQRPIADIAHQCVSRFTSGGECQCCD